MNLLNNINSPNDLKKLSVDELPLLANEIREFLIENVTKTGGHLSPNLGVVELTIALHYVFNTPSDSIIWDVGHQAYTHKILTGRRKQFNKLRKPNGLSGYPSPAESKYDEIHAGHSSTSLSIAAGMANAKLIQGEKSNTLAVIGDGSFTAGMVYEAMNTISHLHLPMIIVLNDNGMSISENVGGISNYLTRIRTSTPYVKFKRKVESIVGNTLRRWLFNIKESISRMIAPGGKFFHDIGIAYYGPYDGHNIAKLISIFREIKDTTKPILLHIITQKGKGHRPAEDNPTHFHGIAGISVNCDDSIPLTKNGDSYSKVFGETLTKLAKKDKKICAITAAMSTGTGLTEFAEIFPKRFTDVGIAEQHAVDYGVGLALKGLKPVVAIYSTFLQRSYDQLLHDAGIGNIKILFCLDRAGLVPDDGKTHQGIFDIAFLRMIPNFKIMLPATAVELKMMMDYALNNLDSPIAIRYPKEIAMDFNEYDAKAYPIEIGQGVVVSKGKDIILVSTGALLKEALKVKLLLKKQNISIEILNLRFAKPINKKTLKYLSNGKKSVMIIEEGIASGGVAEYLYTKIKQANPSKKVDFIAINDVFPSINSREKLLSYFSLTATKIADKIVEAKKG